MARRKLQLSGNAWFPTWMMNIAGEVSNAQIEW
jgi:hypothetical protein